MRNSSFSDVEVGDSNGSQHVTRRSLSAPRRVRYFAKYARHAMLVAKGLRAVNNKIEAMSSS